MKEYFLLHIKMLNRRFEELGLNSLLGYLLSLLAVFGIVELLFYKTQFAQYVVVLIGISFLLKLSIKSRTEFLLVTFGNKGSRKIRILENGLISLPILIILVLHNCFLESFILLIASFLLANISFRSNFNIVIPTPFREKPFEFTVGFRNTFYLFPVSYLLTIVAISVSNVNLGIFSIVLVFLIASSYYTQPENDYYVWSYAQKPKQFLLMKIGIATQYSLILSAPMIVTLIGFNISEIGYVLLFVGLGLFFLWSIILAKYSAYPNEIGIPEAVFMFVCVYFPPILILVIPYLFSKSVKNLKSFLK